MSLSEIVNDKPRDNSAPIIELRRVSKRYTHGTRTTEIFRDISLSISASAFLAMMGPSGSGKTTILNIVGALDRPTSGSVIVADATLDGMSSHQLARWRARNVGFVFQSYNLLSALDAYRNVEFPLLLTHLSAAERRKRVELALELVGFRTYARARTFELSGGQQQRVAIARAIVADPRILLCDEPTGDLDRQAADEVLQLLKVLNEEYGKTIILVTHDPIAAAYASIRMRIDKGELERDASS